MYQLYCAPNTYAMGPHVLLEELGVDYEVLEVEILTGDPAPDFIEASPHARVPALKHQHGSVFESGAIALYLADAHADRGFSVSPDHPQRARYLQWLFYLSSTLQPEVLIQYHPEFYFEDTELQGRFRRASMQRLCGVWAVLDQACASGPYLVGGSPTAVDFCLAIQLQWDPCFDNGISDYPNLERLLREISNRPAYRRAMSWHEQRMHK